MDVVVRVPDDLFVGGQEEYLMGAAGK